MLALFIILVSLRITLFCEKILISNRCISGLMSNLIKKSWTVSSVAGAGVCVFWITGTTPITLLYQGILSNVVFLKPKTLLNFYRFLGKYLKNFSVKFFFHNFFCVQCPIRIWVLHFTVLVSRVIRLENQTTFYFYFLIWLSFHLIHDM